MGKAEASCAHSPIRTRTANVVFSMTSVLKAQKANALKADAKGKGKRKADDMEVEEGTVETPAPKRIRNKQRVLLLSSRGITHRMRHLMTDIETLLPHVKKGVTLRFMQCISCTNMLLAHKTQNWIPKTIYTYFRSSQILTIVTMLFTLKRGDTRTCTCGPPKHLMVRV